jgi:hypothetical protein
LVSLLGAFNASSKTFVNGIGSTFLTAYKIDAGDGNWENRFGVIASGVPDTISNAGFISSNTGSPVSFGSGTKTVTCVPMSELFLTAAISPVLAETDHRQRHHHRSGFDPDPARPRHRHHDYHGLRCIAQHAANRALRWCTYADL